MCLVVAGVATCLMAGFHFFLPHIFGWGTYVKEVPAPISWGLFAINFFFSCLLLGGGIATIIAGRHRRESPLLSNCIIWGMGIFWIIDLVYQIVFPFPVATVRWVLLTFAAFVALLYIFAIQDSAGSNIPRES